MSAQDSYPIPESIAYEGENGIYVHHKPTTKRNVTPLTTNKDKISNGAIAEQEVIDLFMKAGLPGQNIIKDTLYKNGQQELEFADAIFIFEDTAFLIQIKSRNFLEQSIDDEIKDIRHKRTKAYSQAKKSLDYLKSQNDEGLTFRTVSDDILKITYEDYNWVVLLVFNWNNFPFIEDKTALTMTNQSEYKRVPVTTIELETMLTSIPVGYYLNYLRRMQYQETHIIGENNMRFFQLMDAGVYPVEPSKHRKLIAELDKFILDSFSAKTLDKNEVKNFLQQIDYYDIKSFGELQKYCDDLYSIKDKINKIPEKIIGIGNWVIILKHYNSDITYATENLIINSAIDSINFHVNEHGNANTTRGMCITFDLNHPERGYKNGVILAFN